MEVLRPCAVISDHHLVANHLIPGRSNRESIQAAQTAAQAVELAASASMDTSRKILDIILQYSLNKLADAAATDRRDLGTPLFLSVINRFVVAQKPLRMALPAFPFKSANRVYKVLGYLPDKAEELALERLNTICKRIAEIYAPGATLTIVSDGLVYNGERYTHTCTLTKHFTHLQRKEKKKPAQKTLTRY